MTLLGGLPRDTINAEARAADKISTKNFILMARDGLPLGMCRGASSIEDPHEVDEGGGGGENEPSPQEVSAKPIAEFNLTRLSFGERRGAEAANQDLVQIRAL